MVTLITKILRALLDALMPPISVDAPPLDGARDKPATTTPVWSHPTVPPIVAPITPAPEVLSFATPKQAWHATRVMCDRAGLTFAQKNILCACIYQESEFLVNPRPNKNIDPKTGALLSIDYGIVQVNDHYWIGAGKLFPSVDYVIKNPDRLVQWMIDYMKANGHLTRWSSYKTGVYKKWLPLSSPMWLLAASPSG